MMGAVHRRGELIDIHSEQGLLLPLDGHHDLIAFTSYSNLPKVFSLQPSQGAFPRKDLLEYDHVGGGHQLWRRFLHRLKQASHPLLETGRKPTELIGRPQRNPRGTRRGRVKVPGEGCSVDLEAGETRDGDLHEGVVEGRLHGAADVLLNPLLEGNLERLGNELLKMNPSLHPGLLRFRELRVGFKPSAHRRGTYTPCCENTKLADGMDDDVGRDPSTMTTASVNPQNPAAGIGQNPNLVRDTAIGAGLGLFLNNPILGALGGLAYNLFTTPGMADGMKAAAGEAFAGLQGNGGIEGAVQALGKGLFGSQDGAKTQADPDAAKTSAQAAETKSGIPGWAKMLGLGAGGLMLFNGLFDNFAMNGFGNPLYGGFGMAPFMDPMMGMMGMDPMMGMMGMGPMGMMTNNILGGMGLVDLLIAGGVGYGAYKMFSK